MRYRTLGTGALLLALAGPAAPATMHQLRQLFGDSSLSDAQVIEKAATKFNIPAVEIANEVGYTGQLESAADGHEPGQPLRARGIHNMAELRTHYGVSGAGKSDDELVRDYAPRVDMSAYDLALKLGYQLGGEEEPPVPAPRVNRRAGSTTDRLTERAAGGAVLGGLAGLVLASFAFVRYMLPRIRDRVSNSARVSIGSAAVGVANAGLLAVHAHSTVHDALYVQAMAEVDEAQQDKATWARAIAASDGNDAKAKANYIKLRVAQLGGGR